MSSVLNAMSGKQKVHNVHLLSFPFLLVRSQGDEIQVYFMNYIINTYYAHYRYKEVQGMALFLKKLKILFLRQIGHLLWCWVDGLQICALGQQFEKTLYTRLQFMYLVTGTKYNKVIFPSYLLILTRLRNTNMLKKMFKNYIMRKSMASYILITLTKLPNYGEKCSSLNSIFNWISFQRSLIM